MDYVIVDEIKWSMFKFAGATFTTYFSISGYCIESNDLFTF